MQLTIWMDCVNVRLLRLSTGSSQQARGDWLKAKTINTRSPILVLTLLDVEQLRWRAAQLPKDKLQSGHSPSLKQPPTIIVDFSFLLDSNCIWTMSISHFYSLLTVYVFSPCKWICSLRLPVTPAMLLFLLFILILGLLSDDAKVK